MTAPLTPPDCDLQDYPFMPLHVARLRDSDLAAEEDPEACWYAVLLWAAAWHQLPAASLPDNDAVLTKLIGLGRDLKTFRKHRAGALRGFILCDDGRLYHPIVAEQAVAGWRGKLEQRWRTECARIKKRNQRDKTNLPLPTFADYMATLPETSRLPLVPSDSEPRPEGQAPLVSRDEAECPSGNALQEKGKGTETGIPNSDPEGSARGAVQPDDDDDLDPLAELRALPIAKGCWRLAVKVLQQQGGLNEPKARAFVGRLKQGGLTDDELWEVAEATWREQTQAPQPYMIRAAEGVIERRGSGSGFGPSIRNPSPERQRLWMDDWKAAPRDWREHERGPPPGAPGCQVAAEIQREFGVEPAGPQVVKGAA